MTHSNSTILDDIFSNAVSTTTSSTGDEPEKKTVKLAENSNGDNTKKENTWDISEELISKHSTLANIEAGSLEYDELPTDEEFNKQAASHAITAILEPSNQLKNVIHEYLISNDIKTIPVDEFTSFNTFTMNNQKYLLDSEGILQEIYKIILNFESTTVQTKILKNQRSLKGLLNELPKQAQEFNHEVLQNDIVVKLLKRVFSTILLNILKSEGDYTLSKERGIHKNTVCSIIGEAIFDAYMKMIHIYENTSKYEHTGKQDENKAYAFLEKSTEELNKLVKNLGKENKSNYNTAMMVYSKRYVKNDSTNHDESGIVEKSETNYNPLLKYQMEIGYEIVEWLISQDILTEGEDAKKIPYIEIKKELLFDLLGAASLFKPFISTEGYPEVYKTTTGGTH